MPEGTQNIRLPTVWASSMGSMMAGAEVALWGILKNSTSPRNGHKKGGEGGEQGQPDVPRALAASGNHHLYRLSLLPAPDSLNLRVAQTYIVLTAKIVTLILRLF
jgi:hypothetical protein